MMIEEIGFKIATPKQIFTIGRDYLLMRHGRIEVVKLIALRPGMRKFDRDHFIIKSYRTNRIRILKSAGHFV